MSEIRQHVQDRDDWPDGTVAAYDGGAPMIRLDGKWWIEDGADVKHPIPGAIVLRVGDRA